MRRPVMFLLVLVPAVIATAAVTFEAGAAGRDGATTSKTPVRTESAHISNPKIKPGLVNWHADFDVACAAARKSGKPVLLFQMLGNLDDRFC